MKSAMELLKSFAPEFAKNQMDEKALLSRAAWARAQEIASITTCLELTIETAYFEEYTAALFLPHTDLSQFPSAGNF